jgi:transcription-repair coupling factor (superfamily II helicase)
VLKFHQNFDGTVFMQSQAPFFHYLQKNNPIDLLICEDDRSALVLADVAKYFQKDVVVFPDFRASYGDDLRAYQEELHQLFSALQKFYTKKDPLAIVPLRSLLFPLPKKELFDSFSISFGDTLSLETLKNRLIEWGYNFVDIVELSGEVSFRGDIIDIFPPACEHPYRISLFDTEVEQIKALLEVLPAKQLWINPDCGLKTRRWEEVIPALRNLVKLAEELRQEEQ